MRIETQYTLRKMTDRQASIDEHRALIEKIATGRKLTVLERVYMSEWLREVWLPAKEVKALRLPSLLEQVERYIAIGKMNRKHFPPLQKKKKKKEPLAAAAEKYEAPAPLAAAAERYETTAGGLRRWRKAVKRRLGVQKRR